MDQNGTGLGRRFAHASPFGGAGTMRHPTSRILFSYWDGLRGERSAPERGEIEPGAIRHVLADTFILALEGGTPNFRLAGTRLCALFGGEMKELPLIDLWQEDGRHDMRRLVEAIMDDAAGVVGGVTGRTRSGHAIDLELLMLPLRHRGKTHARILGALSPATVPAWLGLDPVDSLRTLSLRMIWSGAREKVATDPASRRRRLVVHEGGRAQERR
jgi:hypothetical protein